MKILCGAGSNFHHINSLYVYCQIAAVNMRVILLNTQSEQVSLERHYSTDKNITELKQMNVLWCDVTDISIFLDYENNA
jgi:hypothetical protein